MALVGIGFNVLQTENGTDWKKIIKTLVIELDNSTGSLEELDWLYFVSNLEEFKDVIDNLN